MKVQVLYFAKLKQASGKAIEDFTIPENYTLLDLYHHLKQKYPSFISKDNLAYSVNESYVSPAQVLKEGDRVSFIPPVAGG